MRKLHSKAHDTKKTDQAHFQFVTDLLLIEFDTKLILQLTFLTFKLIDILFYFIELLNTLASSHDKKAVEHELKIFKASSLKPGYQL